MGVAERIRWSRLALLAISLLAVLTVVWGQGLATTAQAEGEGGQMALGVSGPGVSCDDEQCEVPLGGSFTLAVDVTEAPEQGYILIQTFINYGTNLTYNMTEAPIDEVIWPDNGGDDITLRGSTGPGLITHGALTSLLPPQPISTYVGTIVQLSMDCTDSATQNDVQLLPIGDAVAGPDGSAFSYLNGEQSVDVAPKPDSVTIYCGEPPVDNGDGGPGQEEPTALPPSGTAGVSDGGSGLGAGAWAIIAALVAAGVAGLGLFGWRAARGRQLR